MSLTAAIYQVGYVKGIDLSSEEIKEAKRRFQEYTSMKRTSKFETVASLEAGAIRITVENPV